MASSVSLKLDLLSSSSSYSSMFILLEAFLSVIDPAYGPAFRLWFLSIYLTSSLSKSSLLLFLNLDAPLMTLRLFLMWPFSLTRATDYLLRSGLKLGTMDFSICSFFALLFRPCSMSLSSTWVPVPLAFLEVDLLLMDWLLWSWEWFSSLISPFKTP